MKIAIVEELGEEGSPENWEATKRERTIRDVLVSSARTITHDCNQS